MARVKQIPAFLAGDHYRGLRKGFARPAAVLGALFFVPIMTTIEFCRGIVEAFKRAYYEARWAWRDVTNMWKGDNHG